MHPQKTLSEEKISYYRTGFHRYDGNALDTSEIIFNIIKLSILPHSDNCHVQNLVLIISRPAKASINHRPQKWFLLEPERYLTESAGRIGTRRNHRGLSSTHFTQTSETTLTYSTLMSIKRSLIAPAMARSPIGYDSEPQRRRPNNRRRVRPKWLEITMYLLAMRVWLPYMTLPSAAAQRIDGPRRPWTKAERPQMMLNYRIYFTVGMLLR